MKINPNVCLDVPKLRKPDKGGLSSQEILATFASEAGYVATIPLQDQRTVIADCVMIYLPEVTAKQLKTNLKRGTILHKNNTNPHTACSTIKYWKQQNVQLL